MEITKYEQNVFNFFDEIAEVCKKYDSSGDYEKSAPVLLAGAIEEIRHLIEREKVTYIQILGAEKFHRFIIEKELN